MVVDTNRLKERFDTNQVAVGASCALFSDAVVEIFGDLGLDFVFMDYEHNGTSIWDSLALEGLTRTAETTGIEPIVRIPSGTRDTHPALVRKVLDTGIRNIIVPRIETPAEVRRAVAAGRFRYDDGVGDRGAGSARGSKWGAGRDDGWIDREDNLTLVGIMIENTTAVDHIDEITTIPDLGFVIIGSSDLSISLGRPFDRDHDAFQDAVETVRAACRRNDVPYGQMGVPLAEAVETVDAGGRLLNIGSDVNAIRTFIRNTHENLDRDLDRRG